MLLASLQPLLHGEVIAAAAKKSSGGVGYLPILLVAFMAIYFLWLRPQRNRLRQAQQQTRDISPGDEVVTNSGIVGHVLSIEGDRVVIETGHGHTMTVLRSAIARRVDAPGTDFPAGDDEPPAGTPDTGRGLDDPPTGLENPTDTDKQWWPGASDGPAEGGGGPS